MVGIVIKNDIGSKIITNPTSIPAIILMEKLNNIKFNAKLPLFIVKNESDKIVINSSNLDIENFDRNKFKINLNRIALIFIAIFIVIVLYSTKIIFLSSKKFEKKNYISNQINRADITDRNGNFISKSVFTTNVGIDPKLVKNKKKLLIKLQYTFPEKNILEIENKLSGKNFFLTLLKITSKFFSKFSIM